MCLSVTSMDKHYCLVGIGKLVLSAGLGIGIQAVEVTLLLATTNPSHSFPHLEWTLMAPRVLDVCLWEMWLMENIYINS